MGDKLSLPLRLAILVAGTALPLILFGGNLVYREHLNDRADAEQRVLEVARSIRVSLDVELRSQIAALRTLALSRALETSDIPNFRSQAEKFVEQYGAGANIVLVDSSGQQLLDLSLPVGAPLPRHPDAASNEQVFKTGMPVISDLTVGQSIERNYVTVNVPALNNAKVLYNIVFYPPLEIFQRLAFEQRPSDEWVISIVDSKGTHIARVPRIERVGQRVSSSLLPSLLAKPEGLLESTSLEGTRLITVFTTSMVSKWIVTPGLALSTVTGPLWTNLLWTIGVGLLCVAAGLFFALRLAREVAHANALQKTMLDELNHRVGNTLAIVQSIAAQTFSKASDPAEARKAFDARLVALARAHRIMSVEKWGSAEIRDIVMGVLEPYALSEGERVHTSGPSFRLTPRHALMVSMALHELATNAAKHGALSNGTGKLFIDWSVANTPEGRRLNLRWKETGGPPVENTGRKGFGSALIEKFFVTQFGGKTSLVLENPGAVATFEFPHD